MVIRFACWRAFDGRRPASSAARTRQDVAIKDNPAMGIPCGLVDGLSVGMTLVGRRCEEATIYRGACAFEQAAALASALTAVRL